LPFAEIAVAAFVSARRLIVTFPAATESVGSKPNPNTSAQGFGALAVPQFPPSIVTASVICGRLESLIVLVATMPVKTAPSKLIVSARQALGDVEVSGRRGVLVPPADGQSVGAGRQDDQRAAERVRLLDRRPQGALCSRRARIHVAAIGAGVGIRQGARVVHRERRRGQGAWGEREQPDDRDGNQEHGAPQCAWNGTPPQPAGLIPQPAADDCKPNDSAPGASRPGRPAGCGEALPACV
jgi:hypothetical protein